ncbi:hypothetical protein SAMN04487888_109186 [Eubacterium callanderi]|uniref:hypothetical protein n=1 Tax=Eubacterium callanderi TaxID=53442 RepID=UPI0008E732AC|nr:hypothetical protein [Eubacterium callanderi]SFP39976.1 hypothetical protein SAMN04487888_109186 [Eubacterium callanderi]
MKNPSWIIIQIIDDYTLVIDAGEDSDLVQGDVLEVMKKGDIITHPITNEPLGNLEYPIAKLDVVNILEKMTICKSHKEETYHPGLIGFSDALYEPRTTITQDPLNVNPESITGWPKSKETDFVDIGDKVVKASN